RNKSPLSLRRRKTMKNRVKSNIIVSIVLSIVCSSIYIFANHAREQPSEVATSVKVNLASTKSTYMLGETVPIDVEVQNIGDADIQLSGVSPQSGFVKILISNGRDGFLQYTNGAWGNAFTSAKTISRGQTVSSRASILLNALMETRHLNDTAGRELTKDKIPSSYAFPSEGVYYLKAALLVGKNQVESSPIQITVTKPIGQDLEVWNKIKNRPDVAFLMQEGQLTSDDKKADFLAEVDEIIETYPDSLLATQMKEGREKVRLTEDKRAKSKELIRQRQNSNPN
ncbi:MAG TPA: hypothetical protein VK468_05225, partial [Pyrinomonadaceae bacterium]|nr:hypothetical protein [Pyrinomonadaceae bacterium]